MKNILAFVLLTFSTSSSALCYKGIAGTIAAFAHEGQTYFVKAGGKIGTTEFTFIEHARGGAILYHNTGGHYWLAVSECH